MRPRTLLILLIVVVGLGAFIWFYERDLPSSTEREELGKKVLAVEKVDVTAVSIESSSGTVRLERQPAAKGKETDGKKGDEGEEEAEPEADWRIVRPLQARADTFAVDQFLDAVGNLEKIRTLEDVKPAAVGLDKPRATVRLKTAGGEKVLKLGAEVPPGGSLVAGLGGEDGTAYVVSDAILQEVSRKPGDWRDRRIFHGEREAVQRITLTGEAGGPVVIARRQNAYWIEKPFADLADKDMVEGLLSDIAGLTAERFHDGGSPAEMGLAPPRQVLEIASQGAPPLRVELGSPIPVEAAPEGQTMGELSYARAGGPVFEVRTRLGEAFQRPPADWRSGQLSGLEVHDVQAFTVKDGAGAVNLTRAGTDWKRGETTISYLPVSDLLFALLGARADRVLSPQEAQALGLSGGKPVVTFELRTQGQGTQTLTLYPAVPEGIPARASGRPSVLLLPASTLGEVQGKLKEVRAAKKVEASG